MALPLLLLSAAFAAGWVMAYGTSAGWGGYGPHGISFILWSRQLQWVLIAASVLFSLGLVGLVAAGRRRVWWMIGLVPVVMLFGHRFVTGPAAHAEAADNPPVVTADRAGFLLPADHVIGVVWNGNAYAFPYAAMFHTPVVVMPDRTGPLVVIWSVYANRALAVAAAREVRARDLEIVSSPVDALIVYNSRLGQFINGVTGLTPDGSVPTGFGTPLQTYKTTWADWKSRHPGTVVMAPYEPTIETAPAGPVTPAYPLPKASGLSAGTRRVCVVAATQPIAIPPDAITDKPLNLTAGQTPLLVVRVNGIVRAFRRQVQGDLRPQFFTSVQPTHPQIAWTDQDTGAGWSTDGTAIEGPPGVKGLRLSPIPVEEDLDWGIEKFWIGALTIPSAEELRAAIAVPETARSSDNNGDSTRVRKKRAKVKPGVP